VLPIFLLLLFGAVEFGRAYLTVHILTNAAREGARTGSMPGNDEQDVAATVSDFLQGTGMDPNDCTTTVQVTDEQGAPREGGLANARQGDRVAVRVQYDFQVLTGNLIPGFQGTVPLRATCVFRHE
jgi:Flp pilus assembly protein TadG